MLTSHPFRSDVVRKVVIGVAFAIALSLVPQLHAQVLIKVNDNVNFKLGVLGQVQAAWVGDPVEGGYMQDLYARRLRLLFAGQVAPRVTFFVETDSPNLGKTLGGKKNSQPTMYLQDAFLTYKQADAFNLDAGLILIPFSRNGLQGATTLLPVDYGAYTFSQSVPTQSNVGRDTGFQARGNLNAGHFEYRLGVFQGNRDTRSHNSFRTAGRAQYNFLDTEVGFFYPGTYLGKKKIFAIGGGYDRQKDYSAYDVDAFYDHPLGNGALTTQLDITRFDGGNFLTTLPKQNDTLFELGYLIGATKFEPVLQYAKRNIADKKQGDEDRLSAGVNYWFSGHNANVKAAWTRVSPGVGTDTNEFAVQLQFYYF